MKTPENTFLTVFKNHDGINQLWKEKLKEQVNEADSSVAFSYLKNRSEFKDVWKNLQWEQRNLAASSLWVLQLGLGAVLSFPIAILCWKRREELYVPTCFDSDCSSAFPC